MTPYRFTSPIESKRLRLLRPRWSAASLNGVGSSACFAELPPSPKLSASSTRMATAAFSG